MTNRTGFANVQEAIEWVHAFTYRGIKPGLARMEWMMEQLGYPQRRLKVVHVAGTNGKGSTVAFIRHVLQEAGYEVGTFTSPFVTRFQERMQINGTDIADADLITVAERIRPLADELANSEWGRPTEFEIVTTMAIEYFAHVAYPDIVIMEVGLGGRLDCTNVVHPLVSVITNIGYDHMHLLGNTLPEIASEKAGIIKNGVPVVTASHPPEVKEVIERIAQAKKSTVYAGGQTYSYTSSDDPNLDTERFSYQSPFRHIEDLDISLLGKHQQENASVAMMSLELLSQYYGILWDEGHLRAGLKQTSWIGRMEIVRDKPKTILDGAHNPQGMHALAQTIRDRYEQKNVHLIFSGMKDKHIAGMLRPVLPLVDSLVLTSFDFPRAATIADMQEIREGLFAEWQDRIDVETNWESAYERICMDAHDHTLIVFCGSLYFISDVRRMFGTEREQQ